MVFQESFGLPFLAIAKNPLIMAMQKVDFEVQRIQFLNWMFYVAEKIDLLSNCQTNNNTSFYFSCLLTTIIEQLNSMNCTTCPMNFLHNHLL